MNLDPSPFLNEPKCRGIQWLNFQQSLAGPLLARHHRQSLKMISVLADADGPRFGSNHSLVFVFFSIGLFLRFYNFWKPSIWIDECGTWRIVAGENCHDVSGRCKANNYRLLRNLTVARSFTFCLWKKRRQAKLLNPNPFTYQR